jgi:5-hydroxyisourate hydrolase
MTVSTTISTHVLDAVAGRPAAGVAVRLEVRGADGVWNSSVTRLTDADGRIRDFPELPAASAARLVFDTGAYLGPDAFYPEVVVTFALPADGGHLHVPLLLSNYSYSTYRGS